MDVNETQAKICSIHHLHWLCCDNDALEMGRQQSPFITMVLAGPKVWLQPPVHFHCPEERSAFQHITAGSLMGVSILLSTLWVSSCSSETCSPFLFQPDHCSLPLFVKLLLPAVSCQVHLTTSGCGGLTCV